MSEERAPRWLSLGVVGGALTALALWLRLPPFDPPSLWLDDLWVLTPSRTSSVGEALGLLVTTPGFSALANLLPWLVGPESWAAQLLPLVAGVAAPAVAVLVGRHLGWSWRGAAGAATVMAVAPQHLLYSTRVKQYTVEALVDLVLIGVAWRVVERRTSAWLLASAAFAATVVSGSAGAFAAATLAATCCLVVSADRSRLRELVAPLGAYGAATTLWWLLYLRSHVAEGLRDYWEEDFITTGEGAGVLLADLRDSLTRAADGFLPVGWAWVWLVAALLVVAWRRPRLALIITAPVAAAAALAVLHQAPLGAGRTEIYLLPSAAIAVGAAVEALTELRPRSAPAASVATVGLCSALVVAALGDGLRDVPYPQHDVRAFVEDASAQLGGPTDLVLVYPATRWAWVVYSGRAFDSVRTPKSPTGFDVTTSEPGVQVLEPERDDPRRYEAQLEAAVRGRTRVVLIASHWRADVLTIEAWFPANGWVEARRDETPGGRRVEYRRA